MNLKEFKSESKNFEKLNSPYFYNRLYSVFIEDGVYINYGDFCSRIMKNGAIKVLKSLGIYRVIGARENKTIYVHEKLELIINTTISENDIISKTIIKMFNGEYVNIPKFKIEDLSEFMILSDDYPHSVDTKKCTYLIYNKHNELYKIGRSSDVYDRLNSLRNEISSDLEIIAYLDTDVEGVLHKEYNKSRVFGEWFNLSIDDILDIKNKYNFSILQLP
jgi:hypothetical protein